jgi:hypothetical protein
MAFGKSATRSGFQIPLERDCSLLVGELPDDIDLPWPPARRVATATGVVRLEPTTAVTGDAGVVARWVSETPKDINAALWDPHTRSRCRFRSQTSSQRVAPAPEEYAELAKLLDDNERRSCDQSTLRGVLRSLARSTAAAGADDEPLLWTTSAWPGESLASWDDPPSRNSRRVACQP